MDTFWWLCFFLLGAFSGFFAGLFGIGGGGVMVPVLIFIFSKMNFPAEHQVHLALATSMAAIVPTAVASLRAHHKRHAVLWNLVVAIAPGVLLGTFAGTFLASYLSAKPLAIFFSCFMAFVALQMFVNRQQTAMRQLPGTIALSATGAGIGGISALVAIGGGTLTVPFLVWCGVNLPVAIGTSAAVGLPIALSGALGYIANGWNVQGLPVFTLGYVYMPAVIAMATASFFIAPLGAALAHRLPVAALKKLFAVLLMGLSIQMLFTLFA